MPPFLATLSIRDYIIAGLSALLLALCVMCFVSISLPFGIKLEGWKPYGERMKLERDALIDAQKDAGKAQQGVNDTKQTQYDTAARTSEDDKKLTDIAVRGAVADYIRTHRVPEGASCPSGRTDPAAESGSAAVAPEVPASSDVLVSEPDLQKLSDAAGYAVQCHNFAVDLAQ